MRSIELDAVTVARAGVEVLRGIDLDVPAGEVLALVGASGSGKTSVLRAIAGLDRVASGAVVFDGVDATHIPAAERNVAFVFQRPVLYPKRSVGRNISFPLELRREPADEIRLRVVAEARALHIEALLRRSPAKLSAGEAQLVQIARALVRAPAVLLLDEPFAHLDGERTSTLRRELLAIQRGFGVTTVIATNDSVDAMTFADRLAVIERGRITQTGAPLEVYEHPRTAAAALMTGDADVIEVRIERDDVAAWIVHPGFRLRAWAPALRRHHGRRIQMIVRPGWWQLDPAGPVTVTVGTAHPAGDATSLWCRVGGHPMTVKLSGQEHTRLASGDEITLRLDRYVLLDPLGGYELDFDPG